MSSTIKIKRTTVAGKSPTNANLSTGELAINLPDGRLYSYSGSRVFEIGANVHSLRVGSGSFSIGNGSITFPNAVANTGFFLGTDGSGTLSFRNTTPLIKSQLANTNTYIATKANSTNPTTSGVLAHTGRATISTNLTVSGNTVVSKLVANGSVGTAGYVLKSTGSGVYWDAAPVGTGTIVSLTTTALKDLTQNDTVVTSAQATSATNYLQVANAVSTFQTKAIERSALANTNSFIKSQLANTNTFIATKVNTTTFNSALANTNTYIATKVNTTTFNSALANTNTYIATKLDTSTASTTYQTKAIERAALANTNTFIATKVNTTTFNSALANTNTYIATKVATTTFNSALANTNSYIRSQLANTNTFIATKVNTTTFNSALANTNTYIATKVATSTFNSALANTNTYIATKPNSASPTTTGVFAHTGRATISTNLAVTANTSVGGDLTVIGNLTVNGTTTTVNSTTVSVDDKNIELGSVATPTDVTADGGGITLKGSTDKTLNWISATSSWTSSENVDIAANKKYRINGTDIASILVANTYFKTILANTNTYIATKVNTSTFNSALANTNTYIATKLDTSTASTTYQTKVIERAALANTNSFIKSQLANTNTYIATKVNTTTFNSALANTNTYIATKVNTTTFNSALANTNSFIKSQLANTNLRVNLINTNLTSTNTAIRLLVSDRLQVANAVATYQTKTIERAALANTNAFIKSQLANTNLRVNLINTNLTSTNTAIRLLVSDRLQVANASATYQTKTVERAALANTNSRITLVNTNLTSTNTAIRLLVSDRLQVANAAATYATKASPTTSGVFAHTGRATISTNLTVSGNTVIGKLVANGSVGTAGYALKSNGSTVYWDAVGGGQVTTAQFNSALANTNTYIATKTNSASPTTSGVLAHTGRATISTNLNVSGNTVISKLVANGSVGTAGYVLKSTGSGVYWDAAPVGSGTVISLTTTALKDLTQNDTVVTSAQTISASGYLQVANAVSTYQTKSIERAALANTNSYIRSQLANTNTYIATKVNTTTFNSALANTNTYIATKTNTSTFNSALANTNTYIRSQLANTNTYIATKAPTANPTTTGLHTHTGRATISTNLTVSGNTIISGLVANGSLGTSNYALKTNGTSVYWGIAQPPAVLGTPTSGNLSNCTVDGTNAVGFLNIPQNSQSTAYTLVLADAGKHILHPSTDATARTYTIPANGTVAYPIGTAITFINMTSQVVTIAITTDTMYLSSAGTTGSRSLAQYGSATAIKMTSTTWLISGSGLT